MMITKKNHPIIMVDNFMGETYSARLNSTIFGPEQFPLYFIPDATFPNRVVEEWNKNPEEYPVPEDYSCAFVNMIYDKQRGIKSPHFELFQPLMDNIMDLVQANCEFSRVRLGFHVNRQTKKLHNKPHIDSQKDHYAALYYINKSDGDTFFFDQYDSPLSGTPQQRTEAIDNENLTIYRRVSPKRNRLVIFDGHQVHASSEPVASVARAVVNFNFTANKHIFKNFKNELYT
jgi:hypothetical protein